MGSGISTKKLLTQIDEESYQQQQTYMNKECHLALNKIVSIEDHPNEIAAQMVHEAEQILPLDGNNRIWFIQQCKHAVNNATAGINPNIQVIFNLSSCV